MERNLAVFRLAAVVAALLLLLAGIAGCGRDESADTAMAVDWASSYEAGMARARQTGKPVMLVFHADWCHWCKKLEEDVFTSPKVGQASERLVNVRVNTDNNQELARKYKVRYLPTVYFLHPSGEILDEFQGDRTPSGFVQAMERVAGQAGKAG
ncbi:MAG: thioredoxin family protein [Desulfatibacillaceae bacterium]